MSAVDVGNDTQDTPKGRYHKRTFTGYGKQDLNKERSKWSPETLNLWEKHAVCESDGSY